MEEGGFDRICGGALPGSGEEGGIEQVEGGGGETRCRGGIGGKGCTGGEKEGGEAGHGGVGLGWGGASTREARCSLLPCERAAQVSSYPPLSSHSFGRYWRLRGLARGRWVRAASERASRVAESGVVRDEERCRRAAAWRVWRERSEAALLLAFLASCKRFWAMPRALRPSPLPCPLPLPSCPWPFTPAPPAFAECGGGELICGV